MKYEYSVRFFRENDELDSLGGESIWLKERGDDGWELVMVMPESDGTGKYYFKRPIQEKVHHVADGIPYVAKSTTPPQRS